MAQVRVREVVGTMQVVDGESLLTAPLLERIVNAVLQALTAHRQDEESRRRDTRVGEACGDRSEGEPR